jgi:acyl dehydratase
MRAQGVMSRRYFEDIAEGERLDCRPVKISKEAIVRFATEFDPQPFHVDEGAARESAFGGLVASSLHTLSACTRAVVEAQGDIAILSGVGLDEVKMFNPVRPEDILKVDAHWVDLKRSKSKPDRGLARIRCIVSNQKGEPVIEYGCRYLISCRISGSIVEGDHGSR